LLPAVVKLWSYCLTPVQPPLSAQAKHPWHQDSGFGPHRLPAENDPVKGDSGRVVAKRDWLRAVARCLSLSCGKGGQAFLANGPKQPVPIRAFPPRSRGSRQVGTPHVRSAMRAARFPPSPQPSPARGEGAAVVDSVARGEGGRKARPCPLATPLADKPPVPPPTALA